MISSVAAPHDALFKKFLTDEAVARDFLETHLPAYVQKLCDFDSLCIENTSFIETHLQQQQADILYSLKIANEQAFIYILVEAQSTPQRLMPFRMLRYQIAIMERYLQQGHKRLPIVIPMLFYSGELKPYPYSINLLDCFAKPRLAKQLMFKDLLLIDLSVIPDEEIKTHKYVALLEHIMKHVYTRDALNLWCSVLELAKQLGDLHKFLESVLEYIVITKRVEDDKGFIEALMDLSSGYKEELMHYKSTLRQEGFEQGLQQGLQQGIQRGDALRQEGFEQGKHQEALMIARKLFLEGVEADLIQKVTGLSQHELLRYVKGYH